MSITLAEARTRLLKYADDVDGIAADSTTVQDDALRAAFHAVYALVTSWNRRLFIKEGSVTTSSAGVGDLSSLSPHVVSVSTFENGVRWPIPAANLADGPTNMDGTRTLKVLYLPALSFPASSGDSFVWGQSSLDLPLLDDLLVLRAAARITMLNDERNATLERDIERAERDAQNVVNFSTWRVLPQRGRSRDSGLAYAMTDAVTLQIVRL